MKKIMILIAGLLMSISVTAEELDQLNIEQLPEAPQTLIKEVKDTCKEWAEEYDVELADLAPYLQRCVNEELINKGYRPLKANNK